MDRHWRASHAPIQGNNICPRCSTPHFPLCPPNSNNPAFPVDPIHFQSHPPPYPPYTTIPDPFHPPRYPQLNPNHNPNLNGGSLSQYHANYNRVGGGFTQGFEYRSVNGVVGMGGDYGVDDRSSKRLKVDGMGSEGFPDYGDNERRLKLIHDHGRGGMNGLGPIEQEYNNNNPRFLETSSNTLYGQYGYRNAPGGSNEGPGQRFYANNVDNRHSHYDHTKYAIPQNGGHYPTSEEIGVQPPLPTTPPPLPPPLPLPNRGDTPGQWMSHPNHSSAPARMSSLLFPIDVSSSTPVHSSYPAGHDAHSLAPPNQHSSQHVHFSGGLFPQYSQGPQTAMSQHSGHGQPVLLHHNVSDKPKIIDALSFFKPPNRNRRPDHFVIILRGLPGSGKSYLARVLRDLEVEHGGKAPRIHSMDDYFMTEVEKVEENETSKSSVRGKKPTPKTVLEYCYEPEMEEAYRSSMLKAFKKTLDEGAYTFTIVDDRNLRVADFAQFWATAKRSGYEVYLLETSYKDPVGCTARNIHGFTRDDVEKMAGIWEEAPSIYLQLDAKSLFHGDDIKESNIQEVDMEMDDEDLDRGPSEMKEIKQDNVTVKTSKETGYDGFKDKKTWDAEADHPDEGIKDLRSSKWSSNLDEDDAEGRDKGKGKSTALSGLFQTYGKEGKTVRWGDQISNTGFSIAAMKKANAGSLIIGSGSGYNLKSNPLRVEESHTSAQKSGDVKQHHHVFQERLRAERESFKVVFDKRRHRIGGVDED